MNENNLVVLFISNLNKKHNIALDNDKTEYVKVLFETYLSGQGNPDELRDYVEALGREQRVTEILIKEILEWQGKAQALKVVERSPQQQKEASRPTHNNKVAEGQANKNQKQAINNFIKHLNQQHKIAFPAETQEYFKVLLDTYLSGQGNPHELRGYVEAASDDSRVTEILIKEILEYQARVNDRHLNNQIEKHIEESSVRKNEFCGESQDKGDVLSEHGKKKQKIQESV